uniref:triadin n=1 Tax=Semicossyphus pulcher TaxID=241346 RepID=UPI0037E8818D
MKDGIKVEEQTEVSRQEVFEDYVNCFLHLCTEVGPCHDDRLLQKAAQYLLREPEPGDTFTLFPFYQSVGEGCTSPSSDCRKFLSAFIKATELLETLCVNLFVQPWKKEIKTLKTFTGPFVYCLVPVLSSSAIQSVLASIGYLPHTDTPPSEYRLSEDANPDRAMLVGFELLLARVECYHLLELHDRDQSGQQELLEVLQSRVGPTKLEKPMDKKTTIEQTEEEKKKKEEAVGKEVPVHLDSRPAVKPQPKPRRFHINSIDHSIMEMQITYPDLAFRGRPLLTDKPPSSRSNSKAVHTANTYNVTEDVQAAELPKRDSMKGTKAAATAIHNEDDDNRPGEVFGDNARGSSCTDRNSDGTTAQDGADDEFSHSKAICLHITMRAGSTAEQSLKPGEPQPTAEPPARTQQQSVAEDIWDKKLANQGLSSLSSTDEEQELRELEERMGQLHVQETKEEVRKKQDDKRGEESTNKERRKKERKASTEGKAEEQNLRKPVMETGPAQSHAASRCTKSSQSNPAVMKEQKQPAVCHPSVLTVSTADCWSKGQQGGEDTESADTSRGEEQLAQSYVIV